MTDTTVKQKDPKQTIAARLLGRSRTKEYSEKSKARAAKVLQSFRKTFGTGNGRPMIGPPVVDGFSPAKQKWIKNFELGLAQRTCPWEDDISQACELRLAGASMQYIADAMGFSKQWISQLIDRAESEHPGLFRRVMALYPKRKRRMKS